MVILFVNIFFGIWDICHFFTISVLTFLQFKSHKGRKLLVLGWKSWRRVRPGSWNNKQTAKKPWHFHELSKTPGRLPNAAGVELKGASRRNRQAWRNRSCKHFGKFVANPNQTRSQTAKTAPTSSKCHRYSSSLLLFSNDSSSKVSHALWSKPIHMQFILITSSVSPSKGDSPFFVTLKSFLCKRQSALESRLPGHGAPNMASWVDITDGYVSINEYL